VVEKFLVLGEALTDCVVRGGTVSETAGGSPMNVAVGLGRLKRDVTLATRFGPDLRGDAMASHTRESGVCLIDQAHNALRTSSAEATLAADGAAEYDFDLVWDLQEQMVPPGGFFHVHTGSIGATLEPGASAVEAVVRREKARGASVSYDPNVRPTVMGRPSDVLEKIDTLVGLSDIVKASDEDVCWLYPEKSLDEVMTRWHSLGASLVVITEGPHGVQARTRREAVVLPTPATSIADTIGAGDSFMSGVLVALAARSLLGPRASEALSAMTRHELTEVVTFALRCAAITVSRQGADPPRVEDLG
jgi:fructokinase